MRRTAVLLVVSVAGVLLAGCVTTSQFMTARSQGARSDVFEEVGEKDTVSREYVLLEIRASIKTHVEGYYPIESKDSIHGKKGYSFVLNIDGQEETIPIHFEKGGRNPEGGTGVRYETRKKIRLAAGSHRVFFGLPAEDYYREFDVTLTAGRTYALTFVPVYKQRIPNLQRIPGIRRFTNGFDRYEKAWTEIHPEPGGQTGLQ
jgi:hypothetical protein